MTVVTELLALLKLDDTSFKTGMKNAKTDAESFGTKMGAAGQKITSFGNKMTMATAPIALGLGIAINNSKQFNDKMANVNTILGITGDEAADLRAEILAFGAASTQGPLEVADAYYAIVSGVQDASTHMAILDAATRTADAGQAKLMATTSGLIAVMNSYGFAADDASHVSDIFTTAVGMGVMTMDQLAVAFPQVTGLASSMGITLDDIGAQLSFMTTQGFSAANSATFLKSMMTTLLNPTTDMADAISALGYESGQAMVDSLGLVGSYEALKDFNGGSFNGLVTSQEALQGALILTSDAFGDFNTTFQDTIEGSTARALVTQGEATTWEELGAKMQGLSIVVGDNLVPVLDTLLKESILPMVDGVVSWMQENPELTQQLILMAGAAVVLGPVITTVGTAVTAMTAVMSSAAAPIIAVTAAILKLIDAYNEYNRIVGNASQYARDELQDEIALGVVSQADLEEASYNAIVNQFGDNPIGHFLGSALDQSFVHDISAGAFTNNIVNDPEYARQRQNGTATLIEGHATGGGVPAGSMMFNVNEDGMEWWRSDSSGEVLPLGDQRGGGGAVINVYQLPGEDGVALAGRIKREMMRTGMVRA